MKKIDLNKLFNFKNKVVVITGSEGKIGSKISDLYINLGSKVYSVGLKSKKQNFIIDGGLTIWWKTKIEITIIFF